MTNYSNNAVHSFGGRILSAGQNEDNYLFASELECVFSLGSAGVAAATYRNKDGVLSIAVAYAPQDIKVGVTYKVNDEGQFIEVNKND